jgi:hypothetical protein
MDCTYRGLIPDVDVLQIAVWLLAQGAAFLCSCFSELSALGTGWPTVIRHTGAAGPNEASCDEAQVLQNTALAFGVPLPVGFS